MPILYPWNTERKARLLQLAGDAQDFLHDSKQLYRQFRDLNSQVNDTLRALCQEHGLPPPQTTPTGILKAAGAAHALDTADTTVEVCDLLLNVGGTVVAAYFAPAAAATLVDIGVLSEEMAATVLIGAGVTIGTVAGAIGVGLVVGGVVAGIGVALSAYEGAELRDQLRDGIRHAYPLRISTRMSADNCRSVVAMLQALCTALDALSKALGVPVTQQMLDQLVDVKARPVLAALAAARPRAVKELRALDVQRHAWTTEDPSA